MGVQIFNKDVSVVSSIKGIAKANINNITVTIKNVTDSNIILDTFIATGG